MKSLKDIQPNEVVKTSSKEEDLAFRTLLDKNGYKWWDGDSCLHDSVGAGAYIYVFGHPGQTRFTIEHFMKHEKTEKTTIFPASLFLEFVLPEKWVVKVTMDNLQILQEWRGWLGDDDGYVSNFMNGCYYREIPDGYTEITFDQFKQYVLKQNPTTKFNEELVQKLRNVEIAARADGTLIQLQELKEKITGSDGCFNTGFYFYAKDSGKYWTGVFEQPTVKTYSLSSFFINANMKTITREQLREIRSWTSGLCEWNKKLIKIAERNALNDLIEVTDQEIAEGSEAANGTQKLFLEGVFGKREEFNAQMLKDWEMMEVTGNNNYNGRILMKVGIAFLGVKGGGYWGDTCSLKGKKLPSGTKIEIIAK